MLVRGILAVTALAAVALAQDQNNGFTLQTRLDSTVNALGVIARIDPVAGYRLNKYVAVEAGLPFYFVKPSDSALPLLSAASGAGLGNAHLALRFNVESPSVTYRPSVTITAPTGDKERGLSTGHMTWAWGNLFQRTFGRVTPYGSIGVSNTVSDSPFFLRPFTSKGLVGQFEGGALISLSGKVNIGGSGYAIEPSGEQTVVSRVIRGPEKRTDAGGTQQPPAGVTQRGGGRGNKLPPVWETTPETMGTSEIVRDRGASIWLGISASRAVDLYAGYTGARRTRSTRCFSACQ